MIDAKFAQILLVMLAISFLGGCDKKAEEARNLGFSDVAEMDRIHAQGWHTKFQYDSDKSQRENGQEIRSNEKEKMEMEFKNSQAKTKGFESYQEMEAIMAKGFQTKQEWMDSERRRNIAPIDNHSNNYANSIKNPEEIGGYTPGVQYVWRSSGSCKEGKGEKCLSKNQYEDLCKNSSGVTKIATGILLMFEGEIKKIYDNGGAVSDIKVYWSDSHKYSCRAQITVSGFLNGTSYRKTVDGGVSSFILSKDGEFLASHASAMDF